MNILHLSDIHFGREDSGIHEPFSRRGEILDKLIDTLASLDDALKPELVLVTGDIAWTGKITEFEKAYNWFQRLKTALSLDVGRFVFCPGNHDLNRGTAINFHEEDLQQEVNGKKRLNLDFCDEMYEFKNVHRLETRFHNFNVFCEKMGMQPYSYKTDDGNTEYSYLVGSSELSFGNEHYLIACFNTAYLPYGKVLKDDQMFLGLRQIQAMIDGGVLTSSNEEVYRIALFHHADRYLHPNEQCEYNDRKASLPLLMDHVDLALCGHTETGGVPLLRTFGDGGSLLSGGAAYYNDDHPNSFSLIRIEKRKKPDVYSFYYKENQWVPFSSKSAPEWTKQNAPIVWKNYIHNYPRFTFAVQVDEHRTELYSGHFSTRVIGVPPDKFMVLYDNYINPARVNDVFVDDNGPIEGTGRRGVKNAPGMWNTMEARILISKYNDFVKEHISDASSAFHGLIDSNGKWVHKMLLSVPALAAQYKNYVSHTAWYEMVQKIEDFFEVIFLFPDTINPSKDELEAVSWLSEIMEYGDVKMKYPDVIESWLYAHRQEELCALLQTVQRNGMIGFHFERKLKFRLFGTEIDLKECDIYCIGAQPKNQKDLCRKIDTWATGDRRTAELNFPEGIILWIRPRHLVKENKAHLPPVITTFHMPPQAAIPMPESMKQFVVEYEN